MEPRCSVGNVEASECFSPEREGEFRPAEETLEERPIYPCRSDLHRDEHEQNSAFETESECACNAAEVTSPEISRECTA